MRCPSSPPCPSFSACLILSLLVFSAESPAQQPIKDINANPLQLRLRTNPSPARPGIRRERQFLRLGAWTYFKGNTPVTGAELFRTNGSKTELVKDIYLGSMGSDPKDLTLIGSKFWFTAEDPLHGRELWLSDGMSKGTRMLRDFVSGPKTSWPHSFAGLSKGRVLFSLGVKSVQGLWITDGTPTGTRQVAQSLIPLGVWGTRAVRDGSLAYFNYTDGIWRTDGTTKGTRRVFSAKTPFAGGLMRPFGSQGMLFQVPGPIKGDEIWMVGGAAKTPVRLLTLTRYKSTNRQGLVGSVEHKGKTWFTVGSTGAFALYSTDGTVKGTVSVASWVGDFGFPTGLTTDGNLLWFLMGEHRFQQVGIWTSDGTRQGTMRWAAVPGWYTQNFCLSGGRVFLRASTPKSGYELWVSNGTKAGTFMVSDIVAGAKSSGPMSITEIAPGQVLFSASDGGEMQDKREPWISKGTAKSTKRLDLRPWSKALDTADDRVNGIVGLHGQVLFSADDGKNGPELWRSDGTAKGTVLVKDILPGPKGGLRYSNLFRFGNKVLFGADDGLHGQELWISDGTARGTRMLKNLQYGIVGSWPGGFVSSKGRVFFAAAAGGWARDPYVWVTDGSSSGTRVVPIGKVEPYSLSMAALPEGRVLVSFRKTSSSELQIWVSDGTSQGTRKIMGLMPIPNRYWFRHKLFSFQGKVYFALDDSKSGIELWVSDGTSKGTHLFLNIASDLLGTASSSPSDFYAYGGLFYFQADTKTTGRALWRSDGTVKGTRYHSKLGIMEDANSLTAVGSRHLYFSAKDARGMQNLASMDLQGKVRFFSGINTKGHASPSNWLYGSFPFAVEDGAIWLSAKKHGYDRQLYALRNHAVATRIGDVMASTTLSATDPVQGQSATIEARTQVRNPILLVMLGLPSRKPWSVPPFYLLYYDFTAFALPVGMGLGNKINIGFPIPLDKSITGAKVMLQAWSLDPRRFPQGLELSNAVHLYVGR